MSGSTSPSADDDLARECLYRFLSAVVAGPYSADWDRTLREENQNLVIEAWHWLQPETDEFEMIRLMDELNVSAQSLCAQYDRVFGLVVLKLGCRG